MRRCPHYFGAPHRRGGLPDLRRGLASGKGRLRLLPWRTSGSGSSSCPAVWLARRGAKAACPCRSPHAQLILVLNAPLSTASATTRSASTWTGLRVRHQIIRSRWQAVVAATGAAHPARQAGHRLLRRRSGRDAPAPGLPPARRLHHSPRWSGPAGRPAGVKGLKALRVTKPGQPSLPNAARRSWPRTDPAAGSRRARSCAKGPPPEGAGQLDRFGRFGVRAGCRGSPSRGCLRRRRWPRVGGRRRRRSSSRPARCWCRCA